MSASSWFDGIPVLGDLPVAQAAAKLHEMGEETVAEQLIRGTQSTPGLSFSLPWSSSPRAKDYPYSHTTHAFGYIPPAAPGNTSLSIYSISSIRADPTLRNNRLKITLDRLRAASYPGKGMHHILIHFFGKNQLPGKEEELHFNATYRVQSGEHAAIQGYPIFVGLTVGGEGISFRCRTINIKNEDDEAFLKFLDSDAFTSGLKLATVAQPAIEPLSKMALGIARMVASRHQNVSIQDFDLGLDFSQITTRAPLAEGSYVAVQVPERDNIIWNWDEWIYQRTSGLIIKKNNAEKTLPHNYLVFSISRYEEDEGISI